MKQLFQSFNKTYLLNLPDRSDRLRGTERELQRIGLSLGDVTILHGRRPTEQGGFYSLGAKGSFYAHRSALQDAAANNLRNMIVLEDDVSFLPPPQEPLHAVLNAVAAVQWDIIYFGYLQPPAHNLKGPLVSNPPLTIGGHFYAVNGSFIPQMLQYMNDCEARPRDHKDGGPSGRDGTYNHFRLIRPDIRVFLSVPNMAVQRSSRSDITPRRFDRVPGLAAIVNFGREIKTRLTG